MSRSLIAWVLGFGATFALAIALLVRPAAPPPEPVHVVVRRDVSKVTDVELELILNRVREGDLHALGKDLSEARKAWNEALRLGEGLWPIHEGLGDSYSRAQLHDEALGEYRTAEGLAPQSARPLIALKRAEAAAAAGRPLPSLQAYLEADQPERLAGKILDQALKVPDAAAAVKAISERARLVDPRVYQILSTLASRLGLKAEAAEALARYVIAEDPGKPEMNRSVVAALRSAKKPELALEVCRAWAGAERRSPEPYQVMGDLLREAGRDDEAVVAYSSIVDLSPDDPQSHRTLAGILRELKRPDEAIAQYEVAKRMRPEEEISWTALGSMYDEQGDTSKSEEILTEATNRFGLRGQVRTQLVGILRARIEKLKAEGKKAESRAIRRKLADLQVIDDALYDLKILMTWDAASDVDLDVYEPGGERVGHTGANSKAGGHYHGDNTRGLGPEVYTIAHAIPGLYQVAAHLHGSVRSKVKFVVILYEDTDREERREETVILDVAGQQQYIRDIIISR